MSRAMHHYVVVVAFLLLGCQTAAKSSTTLSQAKTPSSALTIDSALFGYLADKDCPPIFVATDQIAHRVGQSYGWRFKVRTNLSTVHVREELILPSAGNWPSTSFISVSEDRTTGVTTISLPVEDGMVSHFWRVAEGDPSGRHRVRVWLEDEFAGEFTFEIR